MWAVIAIEKRIKVSMAPMNIMHIKIGMKYRVVKKMVPCAEVLCKGEFDKCEKFADEFSSETVTKLIVTRYWGQ